MTDHCQGEEEGRMKKQEREGRPSATAHCKEMQYLNWDVLSSAAAGDDSSVLTSLLITLFSPPMDWHSLGGHFT